MWETWLQSSGGEDPLEEGVATHCSILAWRILWTEEPVRLQSIVAESQTGPWWLIMHACTNFFTEKTITGPLIPKFNAKIQSLSHWISSCCLRWLIPLSLICSLPWFPFLHSSQYLLLYLNEPPSSFYLYMLVFPRAEFQTHCSSHFSLWAVYSCGFILPPNFTIPRSSSQP